MVRRFVRTVRRRFFPGSADYWDQRYRKGGNSGPGSYGCHAAFKADFLNGFVDEHEVRSVVEFGCGDGNQLGLATYPEYLGLDVSRQAVNRCRELFADDPTKRFELYDPRTHRPGVMANLALSLDVLLHLVEQDVFDLHLEHLFSSVDQYVIIYGSDVDQEESATAAHVRYRHFTDLIEHRFPRWQLKEVVQGIAPVLAHDPRADFFVYEAA